MKRLKTILTSTWGDRCLTVASHLLEPWAARPNGLRVLTYHRIDEARGDDPYDPQLISASPSQFERHMDWLAAKGWAVSLDDVVAALRGEQCLKPGAVLVTFDDANCCFLRYAAPILQRRRLPAVVFVSTAFPDSERRFWWDRLAASLARTDQPTLDDGTFRCSLTSAADRMRALRHLKATVKALPHDEAMQLVDHVCSTLGEVAFRNNVLGWAELRDLARQGFAIAPHTRSHPLLTRVSLSEAREEVVGSLHDVEQQIGFAPRVLAYPAGDMDPAVAAMVEAEGFEAAFTVRRGGNRLQHCDRFRLRRFNIGRGTETGLLRAQLLAAG